MSPAERLIAAAALSPEIEAWISLQLKAGRRPSEIVVLLRPAAVNDNQPGQAK